MTKITVEISPLAYAKIIDWTSTNTEREIGGYLIGKIMKEKLLITEAVFAVAESNPTFVSFDNMMQFKILERLEERGKGEVILGWFHTHPGIQVYMSGTDIATQQIYKALIPEAVAMVNDGYAFAKRRDQKDYKAKFFRVGFDGKSFEVPFKIMTNPNEIIDLLTSHVQDHESAEKIAENTAMRMALSVNQSLETLANKTLLTKKEFVEADKVHKKSLAKTRSDLESLSSALEEMNKTVINKDDFNKFRMRWMKVFRLQRIILFISLGVSLVSLILVIVVLILSAI